MNDVRTGIARQLDALRLRNLITDSVPVVEPSPLDDARGLMSALLVPGGEKVWISDDASGAIGCAQARPRRYVLGWELVRVNVRRRGDVEAVTCALVQDILQYLQDRGIPRLFARTPEESAGLEVLSSCGFTHLLCESIFIREPHAAKAPAATPTGLRYRMPQDAWPLRQLEGGQTPALISQLEGLTSESWSMPRYRVFRREEQTDLIIERDGEMVGWAGWSFVGASQGLREHARLSLLTNLEHADLAPALLDYALYAITSKRPGIQVIVRLRDYQEALLSALLEHDFTERGKETILIKHGRLQAVPKSARKLFELVPAGRTALSAERALWLRSHEDF